MSALTEYPYTHFSASEAIFRYQHAGEKNPAHGRIELEFLSDSAGFHDAVCGMPGLTVERHNLMVRSICPDFMRPFALPEIPETCCF